jgi:hypothetical protein
MDEILKAFLDKAIEVTSLHMGFDTTSALDTRNRETHNKTARHLIRYMLYRVGYKRYSAYSISLKKIAEITNCKHHTTIMNSNEKAEELIFKDRFFRKMVDDFEMAAMDIITMSEEEFKKVYSPELNELKSLYLCVKEMNDAEQIKQQIKNRIGNYE